MVKNSNELYSAQARLLLSRYLKRESWSLPSRSLLSASLHFTNCEHDQLFFIQNGFNCFLFFAFNLLSKLAQGITSQSWRPQAPAISLIGCIIFHFSWPRHLERGKVRPKAWDASTGSEQGNRKDIIILWHNQSVKRFYPVSSVWHYFFPVPHPPSQTTFFIIPASGRSHFKFSTFAENSFAREILSLPFCLLKPVF